MQKNVAGQKIIVVAYDATTGVPKTGDAANISVYVSKDAAAPAQLADTTAAELDATNAPGNYSFDVAQGETNADMLVFSGKSSTANIKIDPILVFTRPPNFPLTSIDANGRLDVIKVAGTTQTAGDLAALAAAIKAKTDQLVFTIAGQVDATAASLNANTIDSTSLAASAANEIRDAIFANVLDTLAFSSLIKVFAAVLAGKSDGMDTGTAHFRDIGDTKDVVTVTKDATGRLTVTLNP